ncbi:hypothetical protein D9M69_580750 [compost metagenome]
MRMHHSLWLITISMLLCPSVSPADEPLHTNTAAVEKYPLKSIESDSRSPVQSSNAGKIGVDHRRAIEAHVRQSDHRILTLLRSATLSNIDSVLKSIDAIRQSNEECIQRFERCREIDAVPSTAEISKVAPPSDFDSKL